MTIISAENLSFSYPKGGEALCGINFSVREGELAVICGESGCGKSTLLKLLKPGLAPYGRSTGEIRYCERPLSELTPLDSAGAIGFVMQNPESQLVTDKVWHELAFSLESVGLKTDEIRRRVGEMASYFGLEAMFGQNTASLSGGQKQLLNLASAAALHPKLLLLDEPTSQLDPIAARALIDAVSRLNRDFGVTVIIAEHRLEELLPICDRVIVMEHGGITAAGPPRELLTVLPENHPMRSALPAAMRLYALGGGTENAPLSVREGRTSDVCKSALRALKIPEAAPPKAQKSEPLISARDLWVSYDKSSPDVLKRTSVDVFGGRIYAVLGGNGSGKTTLLKALAGIIKPLGGRVKRKKGITCAYLPQNPCELFTSDSVREELTPDGAELSERFGLSALSEKHPYDLSGGEQQRLAIAKALLKNPDVLLLDEPTKGMDSAAKSRFRGLLRELAEEGKAVVLVTHDTELAASCADICGLLFDGETVSESPPSEFFGENYFYTTPLCRLSRGISERTIAVL